jgi:hypothetical protein
MVQTSGSQLDTQPQTSRRWSTPADLQGQHASKKAGKSLSSDSTGGHTTTTYDIFRPGCSRRLHAPAS